MLKAVNEISPWLVFGLASLTTVATALGAMPFLFIHSMSQRFLGWANAAAGGMMIAASFVLIFEGIDYSIYRTILGILLGVGFVLLSERFLSRYQNARFPAMEGFNARAALLFVGIMFAHSISEGIGTGVSFGSGFQLGLFITLTMVIHNALEGLAISLVLIPRGASAWAAAGWCIVSSIPQPIVAVPAFLGVSVAQEILPVGLGFAAGAMIWMSFYEIIPEALEQTSHESVATVVTLATAFMVLFQMLLR
jgi:zinc transporter ZupT